MEKAISELIKQASNQYYGMSSSKSPSCQDNCPQKLGDRLPKCRQEGGHRGMGNGANGSFWGH